MATPTVDRAAQLAEQLRGADIRATHDPNQLGGQLPGVLVPPPRFDFTDRSRTWRLLAVAAVPDALNAWQQLDQLVQQVAELLPIETAEPVSFALAADADPLPAYALTFTD